MQYKPTVQSFKKFQNPKYEKNEDRHWFEQELRSSLWCDYSLIFVVNVAESFQIGKTWDSFNRCY